MVRRGEEMKTKESRNEEEAPGGRHQAKLSDGLKLERQRD